MGRLARHRKIKNVSTKGKKPDPAKNAPPSRKDEAEFRKIMEEWNKPPEPRKKKQQQQQQEGEAFSSSVPSDLPFSLPPSDSQLLLFLLLLSTRRIQHISINFFLYFFSLSLLHSFFCNQT
jgi:hypothetical protein